MAFVPLGTDGQRYADELFGFDGEPLEGQDRIDGFVKFGLKMERVHQMIQKNKAK